MGPTLPGMGQVLDQVWDYEKDWTGMIPVQFLSYLSNPSHTCPTLGPIPVPYLVMLVPYLVIPVLIHTCPILLIPVINTWSYLSYTLSYLSSNCSYLSHTAHTCPIPASYLVIPVPYVVIPAHGWGSRHESTF